MYFRPSGGGIGFFGERYDLGRFTPGDENMIYKDGRSRLACVGVAAREIVPPEAAVQRLLEIPWWWEGVPSFV
jgi:hypothetical protein